MTNPLDNPIFVRYNQKADCCANQDEHQTLSVECLDGGSGTYIVLSTTRWALDCPEDIDRLAAILKRQLALENVFDIK